MRFLKAERLFDGRFFLPENTVLVINDKARLQEILPAHTIDPGKIEKLEGIITPGFVNSHCHLELSHLQGAIPRHTGLPGFAKEIILKRNDFSKENIAEHIKDANRSMWNNGIVAVGDISNGEDSFAEKAGSNIFYHTFIELIGLNPVNGDTIFEKGLVVFEKLQQFDLKGSLSPHAPYSTSTGLIKKIAEYNSEHHLPLSIHNQESDEENKFFMGDKNGFEDLYQFLGLDLSWFEAPHCSSLESYASALSGGSSLLVHNTVTAQTDLQSLSSKNISWCFCPAANLYIENKLPDFNLFKAQHHNICLGTDSLASNSQLDVIAEANLILSNTPVFSLEQTLAALTYNGALALGLSEQYGQLHPGKNAGLNLVDFKDSQIRFIKKII